MNFHFAGLIAQDVPRAQTHKAQDEPIQSIIKDTSSTRRSIPHLSP